MRVHLIAIGGSAMHNLALELAFRGHKVSGSDDEIFEPSRSRLKKANLLPEIEGWFPEKIDRTIDAVILGMHARIDNAELLKAQEIGLNIYSYPEFIFEESRNKKRIVVAGSHGKTTTTAMILHVLNEMKIETDYLVGAQLRGFERMVKLSDASIIVLEGDEYLSSPLDRRPKMLHYQPDIAVLTGIAWDHINVFPSFEMYKDQFRLFIDNMSEDDWLFAFKEDPEIEALIDRVESLPRIKRYSGFNYDLTDAGYLVDYKGIKYQVSVFGEHNLQNMEAALLCCQELGITASQFFESIRSFSGAARRLERIDHSGIASIYMDFAHAPSKVKATVNAVKSRYPDKTLTAVLELHTFSSLNPEFLPEYQGSMESCDQAIIYFNPHTLKMKKMEDLDVEFIKQCFGNSELQILKDSEKLKHLLRDKSSEKGTLLLMSSGNFGGLDIRNLFE